MLGSFEKPKYLFSIFYSNLKSSGLFYWNRCREDDETLPHILNHCPPGMSVITSRQKLLALDKTIGQIPELREAYDPADGGVRPDVVFAHNGVYYLVDVTIPFDNGAGSFDLARKEDRYRRTAAKIRDLGLTCQVIPFILGALGTWDPKNDAFVSLFGSKSYGRKFRELCCLDIRFYSRNVYNLHMGLQREVEITAYHPHQRPTMDVLGDEQQEEQGEGELYPEGIIESTPVPENPEEE